MLSVNFAPKFPAEFAAVVDRPVILIAGAVKGTLLDVVTTSATAATISGGTLLTVTNALENTLKYQ